MDVKKYTRHENGSTKTFYDLTELNAREFAAIYKALQVLQEAENVGSIRGVGSSVFRKLQQFENDGAEFNAKDR